MRDAVADRRAVCAILDRRLANGEDCSPEAVRQELGRPSRTIREVLERRSIEESEAADATLTAEQQAEVDRVVALHTASIYAAELQRVNGIWDTYAVAELHRDLFWWCLELFKRKPLPPVMDREEYDAILADLPLGSKGRYLFEIYRVVFLQDNRAEMRATLLAAVPPLLQEYIDELAALKARRKARRKRLAARASRAREGAL